MNEHGRERLRWLSWQVFRIPAMVVCVVLLCLLLFLFGLQVLIEYLSSLTSKGVGRGLAKLKWPLTSIPPDYRRRWFEHPLLVLTFAVIGLILGTIYFLVVRKPFANASPLVLIVLAPMAMLYVGGLGAAVGRILCRVVPRWRNRSLLIEPPGTMLARAMAWLCPRTYTRVYEPIIADMQHEYTEALARGRKWQASWMRIIGYWILFRTIPLAVVARVARQVLSFWRQP